MTGHSLEVTVGSTSSLKENRANNKQDPFAVIRLGEMEHRTDKDSKTGRSVWNHRFYFPLPTSLSEAPKTLELEVWHKKESNEKMLGTCKVQLDRVYSEGAQDAFQTVLRQSGKLLGRIRLHLSLVHREDPDKPKSNSSKLTPIRTKDLLSPTMEYPPREGFLTTMASNSCISTSDFSDASEESLGKLRSSQLDMFVDSESDMFSPGATSDMDESSTFWKNFLVRNHLDDLRKRLEKEQFEVQSFHQLDPLPSPNSTLNANSKLPSHEETMNSKFLDPRFREYSPSVTLPQDMGLKMDARNESWLGIPSILMNPMTAPSSAAAVAAASSQTLDSDSRGFSYLPSFSNSVTSLPQFLSSSDSLDSTDSQLAPPPSSFLLPESSFQPNRLDSHYLVGLTNHTTQLNLNLGGFHHAPGVIPHPTSSTMDVKSSNLAAPPIMNHLNQNRMDCQIHDLSALLRTDPGKSSQSTGSSLGVGFLPQSERSMFHEVRSAQAGFKDYASNGLMAKAEVDPSCRPNPGGSMGLEGFVTLQNFQPSFDGMAYDYEAGLGSSFHIEPKSGSFLPDRNEEDLLSVLERMRYSSFGSTSTATSGC